MKLMKSILGLAAIAATIPYKVIAEENEKEKVCSMTSLTWKANYKSDKENGETTLAVDLLGGLQDAIDRTVNFVRDTFFTEEATPDFVEVVEKIVEEESQTAETLPEEEAAVIAEVAEEEAAPVEIVVPVEEIIEAAESEEKIVAKDARFDEAVQIALEEGKISTSMLQRRLSIGYSRASKIIAAMEEAGVIAPYDGKNARQVLISK